MRDFEEVIQDLHHEQLDLLKGILEEVKKLREQQEKIVQDFKKIFNQK